MKTQLLIFLYRSTLRYKAWIMALALLALLAGCSKEEGIFTEPNHGRFKVSFNSVVQGAMFDIRIDGKLLGDSISGTFSDWAEAGERHMQLSRTGSQGFFLDTVVNISQPVLTSLTLLELDPGAKPIIQPEDFFEIPPPKAGHIKYCFINADQTGLNGRAIDILLYDYVDDMKLSGTISNIQSAAPSEFIELPEDHAYAIEVRDHQTGEVIYAWDTGTGGVLSYIGDGNNVFLLKYYNTVPDPETQGFSYYAADPLVSAKL